MGPIYSLTIVFYKLIYLFLSSAEPPSVGEFPFIRHIPRRGVINSRTTRAKRNILRVQNSTSSKIFLHPWSKISRLFHKFFIIAKWFGSLTVLKNRLIEKGGNEKKNKVILSNS